MIKTDGHKDLPAQGRFWIEPATGRVLMSELSRRTAKLRATIDVSYQSEPLLGLLVPIEMREWYDDLQHRIAHRSTSRLTAGSGSFRSTPTRRF